MASKAMVTYCISTTWHRSRSLLSWRFLVWPKFTFISYVLTLLLSGSTCTKKNLDLRWIGGCEKILFEVRSKRDKKGLGHSVGKSIKKVPFPIVKVALNLKMRPLGVNFMHCAFEWMFPCHIHTPSFLLFSLMRRRWKEALMRFWVLFLRELPYILWPKAALLSTIGNCT